MSRRTYEKRKKGRFDQEVGGSTAAVGSSARAGMKPLKRRKSTIQRTFGRTTMTMTVLWQPKIWTWEMPQVMRLAKMMISIMLKMSLFI
jgi:hypothetical protein